MEYFTGDPGIKVKWEEAKDAFAKWLQTGNVKEAEYL